MTAVSPFTAHTNPLPDEKPATMLSIGAILRKAREERGERLEHCADILKIRRLYLEAIENNHWDELPDMVYVAGFVRSYANYLGLDGDRVVTQLKSTHRGMNRKADLDMPKPIYDMQTPNWRIIVGALIALAVIYAVWSLMADRPVRETITPPPSETAATAVPAATVAPQPNTAPAVTAPVQSATTAPTPASSGQIIIRVTADSWVQIRGADGQIILSRLLRTGESYQIPATGQARLTTGNLSGLRFEIDGKALPTTGKPGVVVRDILLSADGLNQAIKANNMPAPLAAPAPEPAEEPTD